MADSFAKVMSLAIFIVLGYVLRRFNILKEEAFAAISALVMNVTLPCVILTNLNGMKIWAAIRSALLRCPTSSHSFRRPD